MSDNSKDYQWFVEPLNPHTNQVLGHWLAPERFYPNMEDENNKKHQFWLVETYDFITYISKCEDMKFNIFNRLGRFGKLRSVNLLLTKKAKQYKSFSELVRLASQTPQ